MEERLHSLYDKAWSYFEFHASYRLKTFNFFLIISTILSSGSATLLANDKSIVFVPLTIVLGLLQVFISFLFWKLDVRMKGMIKLSENALREIETVIASQSQVDSFRIFSKEHEATEILKRTPAGFWNKHYSYSNCFNLILLAFGLIGSLAILYSIATLFF